MQDLIRAHPFATLVAVGTAGLVANHFPLMLRPDAGEFGMLQGHMAKANPAWQGIDPELDTLAIFQGSHHYVTPSWYPSKAAHGKVVPTWNYAVVHAYGPVRIMDDPTWLAAHLKALTSTQESGRETPWEMSDAPADYLEKQIKGIVGFEIPIRRLEGKWKMSQNRNADDRHGVVEGLAAEGTEMADEVARNIAD